MSDPDWDLCVYCRIRWYKVLWPPPLHVGHRDDRAPSAWRAQGPKHVKTDLVSAWSSNLVLILFIVLEILRFSFFDVLAWNCLFTRTPILEVFGGILPQIWSPIVLTPKRTVLVRKHVVRAIKCENRSSGSTWAQDRENKVRTGQDSPKKSKC